MPNFISHGHAITCVEHDLFFEDRDCPGAGYGFTCSPKGDVLTPENPAARENLAYCLANPHLFRGPYVQDLTRTVRFGPVLRCRCGASVYLDDAMGNTCHVCDRDYNAVGQLLAPRSQWGEETGETYSDIVVGGLEDW